MLLDRLLGCGPRTWAVFRIFSVEIDSDHVRDWYNEFRTDTTWEGKVADTLAPVAFTE